LHSFYVAFSERFGLDGTHVVPCLGDHELLRLHAKMVKNGNMIPVAPPVPELSYPSTGDFVPPNEDVKECFRRADLDYLTEKMKTKVYGPKSYEEFRNQVWTQATDWRDAQGRWQPISLLNLGLRPESMYNACFGLRNGHPCCVTAVENLFPHKFADTVLKMDRPVHKPLPQSEAATKFLDKALKLMYHHLDTEKYFGKFKIPVSFDRIENISLGTSAGLNKAGHRERREIIERGVRSVLIVDASAKKLEMLENDINFTINWMLDPDAPDPMVMWKVVEKDENFYSLEYYTPEEWHNRMMKLRLYLIPSSNFILAERLVSVDRMKLEHGKFIQVEHKHPHGGMDRLARCLKVTSLNEWKKILVEGDIKNMDQSTNEWLINLFYSYGLIYDDPNGPDYDVRKRIIKMLIRQISIRFTHLFGPTWAAVTGGVPSGIFNTSHMDSWIVTLYLMLFVTFQMMTADPKDFDKLEEAALYLFAAIVYGDDHVYNKTEDELCQSYFSGVAFSNFMKTYFDVDIRDMRDGVSFLSSSRNGKLVVRGMTFLKHQAVLNPHKISLTDAQPRYLPFRESFEYFIRIAWGKHNKVRTLFDVILSCIGHAYGTYASNHDAYVGIHAIYKNAMDMLGVPECQILSQVVADLPEDDFKDLRRKGISREELLNGFPAWETLIRKNELNEPYHSIGGDCFKTDFEGEW